MRHTADFHFQGGVLADNPKGADLARIDNITMDGMKIIGLTAGFRDTIETQDDSYAFERVVGLELPSRAQEGAIIGATLRNIDFVNFEDTRSESKAVLIEIDPELEEDGFGNFDAWTKLEGITVPNGVDPFHFDFNNAVDEGKAGLYIVDMDSGMDPSCGSFQGTSTVIADTDDMKTFVDMDLCASFPQQAYLYCKQTCLRTITFAIDPAETAGIFLRITDMNNSSRSFAYRGGYEDENNVFDNTSILKHRYFAAALPPGSFRAEFVRNRNGNAMWPSFVETRVKPALCADAFADGAVELVRKRPPNTKCSNLIRNGDMEDSNSDYPYWLHFQAGIRIVPGGGLGGSNAIADTDSSTSSAYIGQYIDIRCLQEDAMYVVRAWVRLERPNGNPFACNDGQNCPIIRLNMMTPVDDIGTDFDKDSMIAAVDFVQPYNSNSNNNGGWNLLQGTITVTPELAAASSVWFSIERRRSNVKMYLDGVSMNRITKNCNELVFNGDISDGTSVFWERSEPSSSLGILTRQGNHALQLSNRKVWQDAITQNIQTGCMVQQGKMYRAEAKVRVLNPNGSNFACNPALGVGSANACPRMRLKSIVDLGLETQEAKFNSAAWTDHGTFTTNGPCVHLVQYRDAT